VHVHTDDPGTVLKFMTERGQVSEVFIHNMKLQADDRNEGLKADEAAEGQEDAGPAKAIGVVAVASGTGLANILESLGVDLVVQGGQTMNPSTADLLAAVEKVNADAVIILPDNGNIVMAAQAAANASSRPCAVVPTKSVPAAFSAMLVLDEGASLDDNVAAMSEAISDVVCGEVTHAIKRSKDEAGNPIRKGDVIGICGDAIKVVGKDVSDVTLRLVQELAGDDGDYDTLTLLAGSDLSDSEFEAMADRIEDALPDLDVDRHRGEQPLYPIIFSLE
jgi:dihydroxyacetone kinase-like predicted kinase